MAVQRIEVREPNTAPRLVEVDGVLEVGRDCDGLLLNDPKASRRHLRLTARSDGLSVVDLGSTNGTWVNGERLEGETKLLPGDAVRVGGTELMVQAPATAVLAPVADRARLPTTGSKVNEPAETQDDEPGPATAPDRPPPPRPALDELAARESDAAVVRFRPGTPGEAAAAGMLSAARRARRRLAGLGSEPWGVRPQICLVDPFPDPAGTGETVAGGTVLDAARSEIWMVVTAESPPEPPERPLALLFGAALPAADDLDVLLEGYGLHVAETPDPDPQLREAALPPLGTGEGELAGAMARSFVRYLIARGGAESFRRLLAEARPGRVDAAAQDVYGATLAALEDGWRRELAAGPAPVKPGEFLRLSLRYLRPHVRREAEMFVYMLLGLAFTVVFPFAFRRLLDSAIPSGQFSEVVRILGLLGAAFAISLLANLRRAYLSAVVSASVVRQVRTDMFGRLQALSAGWFSHRQEGDVISRLFNDVAVLEGGLSASLREGVVQILSLAVSAVVLIVLNPVLGVIVVAGAPLVGVVYRAMAKGAQKRSIAVQAQTGSAFAVVSENYGAQAVVKAFGLEARERGRFGRSSQRLFDAQVRLQLFGGFFSLSVNMIVTALRLLVLGLGAWLILQGRLTVGGLVAFMGVMGDVLSPVTVLTGIGERVQAATGALLRINEVLDALPDIADAPGATTLPPLEHEIRLEGVSFSYTPERRTLEGVEAVIPAGSRVAFVGPTGAGKSSVLQLLMRFYDPEEGAVCFDGRDVRSATVSSLRAQLGVVFQDTFLFDTTIRENIGMGRPGAADAEIEAAARAAELDEFITTLPRGYDTLVGERGGRLSGGQRQRLAIARALVRDPRLLVLDEATSALDARTERLIADTLDRVGQGRTTIAVTHRLTSITEYDRIFVIVAGKLVEQGTHAELLGLGGVYAGLWAEQTGAKVTADAPFDAVKALARIPLFAGLGPDDLTEVAGLLRVVELNPGDTVREGGGRILLVRRGRARLLVPGIGREAVALAELGPGDAFGVSAILGTETGALLEATEPMSALVLDDQAVAGVAARFASVAAALEGRVAAVGARPAGGRRLSKVTLGPRSRAVDPAAAAPTPTTRVAEEVRRASGSYTAVPK